MMPPVDINGTDSYGRAKRWPMASLGFYAITACGLYAFSEIVGGTHEWNSKLSLCLLLIITSYLSSLACVVPPCLAFLRSPRRSIFLAIYLTIMIPLAIICGILVTLVVVSAYNMNHGQPIISGNFNNLEK